MPWAAEPELLPLEEPPEELLDEELPELEEPPEEELLPPELLLELPEALELLLLLPQALSAQAATAMKITLRIKPPSLEQSL
jgi:hypothetical protein